MLTIDDCSAYIAVLKKVINQEWLLTELAKIKKYYETPKNTRVLGEPENYLNPLAFLIYRAELGIENFRHSTKAGIFNELVDATKLGIYLETLNNVEGISDKINELMRAEKNHFEKLVFELDIASSFLKSNHKVRFLMTKSDDKEQTPDLLIDDNIEIECKKKDRLTKRDRKNQDYWNLIRRKLIELMNKKQKFYLVYLFFEKDPDSDIIHQILKEIRRLINSDSEGQYQVENVNIKLYKICDYGENIPLGIQARTIEEVSGQLNPDYFDEIIKTRIPEKELVDYRKQKPDFDNTDPRITITPVGQVFIGEVMKFVFKTKEEPDRIKSVINSIRAAQNQLSGKLCGLVCVNMTHLSEKLMEQDYGRLGELIQEVLQNNTTISAVAITSEFYQKDPNGIRFLHKAEVIRNKFAKLPLPNDFVIMNPPL